MTTHDIIDNRNQLLIDQIRQILNTTESARFAVGYFFLSGFTSIADKLNEVKELKLLIGNTSTRETIEQMAEGYRRLDLIQDKLEKQNFPKKTAEEEMVTKTTVEVGTATSLMEQTDEAESLIKLLVRMIEEQRLKVKVYTKGRLHAKAYIFNYPDGKQFENGIAIVGSSNLTLAGVKHNTELNVVVAGNDNHKALGEWFDELWDEAQDFDEALMNELKESWALKPAKPYDIYMKTLYTLVKDRLEGDEENPVLFDDETTERLADFQKVAVKQAIQMIKDHRGVFISDVVGLGKSFIGAAIVRYFVRIDRARPLVICPASLVEMWDGNKASGTPGYNQIFGLGAEVVSMGMLDEAHDLLNKPMYKDCDFVLIDESHNLRHKDTQHYRTVQEFLKLGDKKVCFLTATPRSKSAWDVFWQLKLFHPDDKTDLPISPPNIRTFFKKIDEGEKELPELLTHILIRRTRKHILRWYGYDSVTHRKVDPGRFQDYLMGARKAYVLVDGKHQFFPKRDLETVEYSIEKTYQGLYDQLRNYFGKPKKSLPSMPPAGELTYARFGLWHFVNQEKKDKSPYSDLHRAGINLRGLMRVLLFKRFESSVYAFRETVKLQIKIHELFLKALDEGIIPAGEKAEDILYKPGSSEPNEVIEALEDACCGTYQAGDFDTTRLRAFIEHDLEIFRQILNHVEPITPDKDAKLQKLIEILNATPLKSGKRLIFTQYADTADYLFYHLNPDSKLDDIDVISSGSKSKVRLVGRFAPKANNYQFSAGETELNTVVATDVLAEGLNMQDCDKIINYDLHWNPVRLIQRFGRIDRIGSDHDKIFAFNFLPELGIERNIGLKGVLHNRIQEIHDTIGEDAEILDKTEKLNEEALYAIYEKNGGGQLSLFEEDGEAIDLNEAEEMMRAMMKDDPDEFQRITELRDGIRSSRPAEFNGNFVLCQAGQFKKLYLTNEDTATENHDIEKVLGIIRCGTELEALALPAGYNKTVSEVRKRFASEVKHRQAEKDFGLNFTQGQKYILRELRILFSANDDQEIRDKVNILEQSFKQPLTTVLNKELNRIRHSGLVGQELLSRLTDLYNSHRMNEWDNRSLKQEQAAVPVIVCSEGLRKQ